MVSLNIVVPAILVLLGLACVLLAFKRPGLILKLVSACAGFLVFVLASVIAVSAVRALSGFQPIGTSRPMPPGVLIGGFVGAFAGWRAAPQPAAVLSTLKTLPGPVRLAVAVGASWAPIVLVAVFEFDWLGHYWREAEWARFLLAL